jgi:phosphoglycolate phosphatase
VKLAVWDVDGTLVDSRAVILDCCRFALVEVGMDAPDYEAVRHVVGLSLGHALAVLAPSLDAEALTRAEDSYKARFRAHRADPQFDEPLYEGAVETLHRLKAEGWRLAIATGKSRRGLESIIDLHGWGALFDSAHCAGDGPSKPDPAMLVAAMRACGAGPADTIMIGDSAIDMRMACAAGVRGQGVSWGFNTAAELTGGGAHHVADDFASLNRQLDGFFNVTRTEAPS